MSFLIRMAREPLIHFLLLGSAVFAVFFWARGEEIEEPGVDRIHVTNDQLERLSTGFEAVWRRPPDQREMSGLVDDYIREEVLVREALQLGLDRDDTVVRRRLRQKMEFLIASAAGALEPTHDELQAHLDANADRFARPARLAFQQVFLGKAISEADIETIRQDLEAGGDPATLGQRTFLPLDVPPSPANVIDSTFGQGFSAGIRDLEPERWLGPVSSGYGRHLVRLIARTESAVPDLEDIRDKVVTDWRRRKAEDLSEAQIDALLKRYDIQRPPPVGDATSRQ